MRVLVLGSGGMLGNAMLRVLVQNTSWNIIGSIRTPLSSAHTWAKNVEWVFGVDLANQDHLVRLFRDLKPDIVVNCAGLTKHLPGGNDLIPALIINALLPHRLAVLCQISCCRLIHISTDCVFSGKKGDYSESDLTDPVDVYGKTKELGEVTGPGSITLRTSIIGHEIGTKYGLLEWFLAQAKCKGYQRAVFSGVTTLELARVVRDYVIPDRSLSGLFHVSAEPISKDKLLHMIAKVYSKQIDIEPDDQVVINRSLNSDKFYEVTGYRAPSWLDMIKTMHSDWVKRSLNV